MPEYPKHWGSSPLDDLINKSRPICYGVLKPGPNTADGIPLVRITDIQGGVLGTEGLYRITPGLDMEFKRSKLEGGELLLSIQGTIGRVAIAGPELQGANISRTIARISLDSSKILPEFVYHWMMSQAGQDALFGLISGTTRSSLNIGTLRKLPVPVPPLNEQRRIAALLNSIDSLLVASTKDINQANEAFSIMRTLLLSHGIDDAGVVRQHETHDYQDHRGLSIPADWKAGRFDDVAVLQRGFDLPVQDRAEGCVSVFGSNGPLDTHDDAKVQGPAIITGRSGTIGKVYYSEADCWPLNTTLWVKDKRGNNPRFIFHYLQNFPLAKFSESTGVPTLNRNGVHPLPAGIPSPEEQERIVSVLDAFEGTLNAKHAALGAAQHLKEGLLNGLLTPSNAIEVTA